MTRTYLERVNYETGERTGRVDVTGKSERQVDRIVDGMTINLHPDWFIDTIHDPALPSVPLSPAAPEPTP
jgi:hypothetical protein